MRFIQRRLYHLQDELYFISSYAYKFNQHFLFFRPFSIGVSVKLGSITSPKSDDATASQKTFVAGLDVGLLTEFADNIRFGLVLKDLPTVEKVNNTTTGTNYLEYEPTVVADGRHLPRKIHDIFYMSRPGPALRGPALEIFRRRGTGNFQLFQGAAGH